MTSFSTSPTKILVVEDDPGARALLSLILEREGYSVIAVEDGETCLTVYPQFQPDLVLLDAILPGIDGFDCCRTLRANMDIPQAPIIMLTSLDSEQAVEEATAAGAANYIAKPIRPAVLKQQIRQFIQQATTQRQLETTQHTLKQQLEEQSTHLEEVLEQLQDTVAQVNEFEQLKTDLIKHLSHNIRNPLNVILTSSELLQLFSSQTNEKQVKYLNQIEKSVNTITDVLTLLTTFEHLTSESHVLHITPINLPQLCQSLVEQAQFQLTARHSLTFTHQGQAEAIAHLDVALTQQVLNELINNAIRYSPAGGTIWLKLHCLTNSVIIQVEDEGIGIPAEEHSLVFNPFYRATNANEVPGTPGVGLGLAIAQQIVALHQGTISLRSTLNRGTTVVICLPQFHLPPG